MVSFKLRPPSLTLTFVRLCAHVLDEQIFDLSSKITFKGLTRYEADTNCYLSNFDL